MKVRKIIAKQCQWVIGVGRTGVSNIITIPHYIPYNCYKLDDILDATSTYKMRSISSFIVFKTKSSAYKYLYKQVKKYERKRIELAIIIR